MFAYSGAKKWSEVSINGKRFSKSFIFSTILKPGKKRNFTLALDGYNFSKYLTPLTPNIKVRVVTNGLWSNIIETPNPNKKILQTAKQP